MSNQKLKIKYLTKLLILLGIIFLSNSKTIFDKEEKNSENSKNSENFQQNFNFDKFLSPSPSEKSQEKKLKNLNSFNEELSGYTLGKHLKESGPNIDTFSIPLAKYFLKIAAYSYCSEENMQKKNCCSDLFTKDSWELVTEEKVSYDDYNYAILMHKEYKKIAVSFPGTRSASQLVKELYYSNGVVFQQDETEKIMEYLKTVYLKFNQKLESKLEELFLKYSDYQFIFTGHSLGGNMAAISILYSVKYGKLKESSEPVLFTFGQARTGNDIFANEVMKYVKKIYRVTRKGDLVTSIPPCSWSIENWSLKCNTILPKGKFDKNFVMSEAQKKEAKEHFYNWHIAGWYSFNDSMDSFTDCGELYSESNTDPNCQLDTNFFDISKHKEYFGIPVGDYC